MTRLYCVALVLLALALPVLAIVEPPTAVTQYQTAAGWRLYMPFHTPHFWPLSDFKYWEIIISRHRVGIHPPYIGCYAFLSEQNYTDPEIELLAPLEAGETFYCMARLWTTGGLFDTSQEFTFSVGELPTPVYSDLIPWIATDYGWESSIVIANASADPITVWVTYRYQTGAPVDLPVPRIIAPYGTVAFYVEPAFVGSATIEATGPAKWQTMTYQGSFITGDSGLLTAQ